MIDAFIERLVKLGYEQLVDLANEPLDADFIILPYRTVKCIMVSEADF